MKQNFFDTEVTFIKGVGPQKAELLKSEANIISIANLLDYYPNRYIDKSKLSRIREIVADDYVQLQGTIESIDLIGKEKAKQRLVVLFKDNTGCMELLWFKNYSFILKKLQANTKYIVFGKVNDFKGKLSITHPEVSLFDEVQEKARLPFEPVYPLTEKLRSRFIESKFIGQMLMQVIQNTAFQIEEYLPLSVLNPLKLISRKLAYKYIHFPASNTEIALAKKRLKFDEMFVLAMRSEKIKQIRMMSYIGIRMPKIGEHFNTFYKNEMPFELTEAQKRVIKEIKSDLSSGYQMNRLLQGDVGSGKTIVALLCMLIAIDNNCQAAFMAPTEILAIQHYYTLKELLKNSSLEIELLTGSTTKKQKQVISERLKNNEINIIVGTHALIEDPIEFSKMGFIVIDEQHRFGVAQRAKLWAKSDIPPHVLVMTATPIPRTLAMSVHGDLDVSVIDELPKNRKPIKTIHKDESFRYQIMEFIRDEIKKGRQAYIVYPLIEENNKLDLSDLMSGYDTVCDYFPVPEYQISILHGKLKSDVKEYEMNRFKEGKTDILIATTVIEVGVNVPNATVMLIENANQFGLAQLHQLRGRVGRGGEQSFCILLTKENLNFNAKKRISTMCQTNNGFEIAKVDLELRGPGEILGTRQSGLPEFKILDIVKDDEIIDIAKRAASFVLKNDPQLCNKENEALLKHLQLHQQDNFWGRIG